MEASMKIKPTNDNLLVEPNHSKQKAGKIYMPDTVKSNTKAGKVLAVGELAQHVQEGDTIVYRSGIKLKDNNLIVKRVDVVAVIGRSNG
jgi:co-chaperonin GroES (HSP10)